MPDVNDLRIDKFSCLMVRKMQGVKCSGLNSKEKIGLCFGLIKEQKI